MLHRHEGRGAIHFASHAQPATVHRYVYSLNSLLILHLKQV
jgi:hypothetical protein